MRGALGQELLSRGTKYCAAETPDQGVPPVSWFDPELTTEGPLRPLLLCRTAAVLTARPLAPSGQVRWRHGTKAHVLAAALLLLGWALLPACSAQEDPEPKPVEVAPQPVAPVKASGSEWSVPAEEGVPEEPAAETEAKGPTEEARAQSPLLAQVVASEQRARAKKENSKPEEWVQRYRQVVEAEKQNAEARYRLGLALARAGKFQEGASELEKALVLAPSELRYLCDYGTVAVQAGEIKKGLDACRKAVLAAPNNPQYLNALGNAFFATGEYPKAALSYQEALCRDTQNTQFIHNLGRALLAGREPKKAVEVLTEVLRMDQHSAPAFCDRGLAYQQLKQTERAIDDFKNALRIQPRYADAHHNLALLFANGTDARFSSRFEATDHAKEAVRLTKNKNPRYLMGLAEAHSANREYAKAVSTAREAIALDPSKANLDHLAKYEKMEKHGFTEKLPDDPSLIAP